jgi:sugar-specific transcriptional regulator TrmB
MEGLMQLGFTEYEARAYITLLQHDPLNGYELARESKLPRANIYAVLDKLESRGAIIRLETPTGTRFAPIPPNELTQRLNHQLQASLSEVEQSLGSLTQPVDYEYIWNARGYTALLDHAQSLIDAATRTLLIALSPQESLALQVSMEAAAARGVEIDTLCLHVCEPRCGRCQGRLYRYHLAPEENNRWLIVVKDGEELITGQISSAEEAQTVLTHQRLLVDLASGYIRRSIALAVLLSDLHDQPEFLLTQEARDALQAVDPNQSEGSWLEHLRRLFPKMTNPPGVA